MKPNADGHVSRPAGFNRPVRKPEKPAQSESGTKDPKQAAEEKKRARAAEKAYRAREKASRRAEKERSRKKRTPEQKRRRAAAIGLCALIVLLAAITAIMLFGDHSKVVHQLPEIYLEGAEASAEADA